MEENKIQNVTTPSPLGEGRGGGQKGRGGGQDFHRANPDWYPLLKEHAKEMRLHPTKAEAYLWNFIQKGALGVKFRRQCVILDFIADFFSPEVNLIIEVDGGIHDTEERRAWDFARTERLEAKEYKVIRFTNEEVLENIEFVIEQIRNVINNETNNSNH